MIIDCHGHYTTASPKLQAFRDEQLRLFSEGKDTSIVKMASVSDDEIIDSIVNNQLKLIKERGGDLTIFSPKASAMGQHQGDLQTSIAWAKESNDLIHRVCELESVAQKSEAREEKEASIRSKYRDGPLGLDMNNMRQRLLDMGLRYVTYDEEKTTKD